MFKNKRSFFERLAGAVDVEDDYVEEEPRVHRYDDPIKDVGPLPPKEERSSILTEEIEEEGELLVDMYQTSDEIVIQAMVAGIHPNNLNISITREMVTISGRREPPPGIMEKDYYYKELYWGAFSRTILLPQEVETDGAEAVERHGMLTLKLPKLDKDHKMEIRVKSVT